VEEQSFAEIRRDSSAILEGGAEAERVLPGYSRGNRVLKNLRRVFAVCIVAIFLWVALRHGGQASWSSLALGVLIAAFNGWCLFHLMFASTLIAIQARNVINIFGSNTLNRAARTWRLYRMAKGAAFTWVEHIILVAVFLGLGGVAIWFGFRYVLGIAAFLLTLLLWRAWDFIRPPIILVLSTSLPDALDTVVAIRGRVPLYRVAALLDNSHGSTGFVRHYYSNDDFRTSDADWKVIVSELAEMVAIIIMDVRHVSEPIKWEFTHTLRTGLLDKTVYVVDDANAREGRTPAMDAQLLAMMGSAKLRPMTTATMIPALVPALLRSIAGGLTGHAADGAAQS
jgi:hypothetical protein